jgi:hypothetical protein
MPRQEPNKLAPLVRPEPGAAHNRHLRCLLRLGIFVLACLSGTFCLIAVFRAQAWLNQQAELSTNAIEAEPQTSEKGNPIAANSTFRFVRDRSPLTALVEIGPVDMGALSREHVRNSAEGVRPEALDKAQRNKPGRSETSRGAIQEIAPGSTSAGGKKAGDDAGLASVSVHRFGKSTIYRVPRE